jgi:integrase/recombinase XerD
MITFNIHELINSIEPFLAYRSKVGYTRNTTTQSNAADLKLFIGFIDQKDKSDITGKDVIAFQQYLAICRHNSPASINRKIFTLRAIQNYLELKGVPGAEQLPFKKVLKIRAPRPYRANFLEQDDIKKLFGCINRDCVLGLRDYAVYALMALLGLRVGEVHRLNLNDIDWYDNTILVKGKCDIERTLYLSNEIKMILENYLTVRRNIFRADKTDALFISKKGQRMAIRTMEDNFKKLIRTCAIEKHFNVTPHTLRHSCATMLNEKEVRILTIQNILGHTNPNTTINYYLHTPQHKMREALEKLPLNVYINQLINDGRIRLTYQRQRYKNTG